MPYTQKAHNYFEAVAHGMKPRKGHLSQEKAKELAAEGVKGTARGTADDQAEAISKPRRRKH